MFVLLQVLSSEDGATRLLDVDPPKRCVECEGLHNTHCDDAAGWT